MRNYICDICIKSFTEEEKSKQNYISYITGVSQSLTKSNSGYSIQSLEYRIANMISGDICLSCQHRIVAVIRQEMRNIQNDEQEKEKDIKNIKFQKSCE